MRYLDMRRLFVASVLLFSVVACKAQTAGGHVPIPTTTVPASGTTFDATSAAPAPAPVAGTPYSVQLTNGGATNQTWAIVSGALPTGLSLSTTGLISGTTTGPGALWSVDVAASPPPPAGGALRSTAHDNAALHLWGWTFGPQTPLALPYTVVAHPDAPVVIASSSVGGQGLHYWRIDTDGTWSEPSVVEITPGVLLPDTATPLIFGAGASSGRMWAVPAGGTSCQVALLDITHGPWGSFPPFPTNFQLTVTPTVATAVSCMTVVGETTVWFVESNAAGQYFQIEAFDRSDGALLRSSTLPTPLPQAPVRALADPDGTLRLLGTNAAGTEISVYGTSPTGDNSYFASLPLGTSSGCTLPFFASTSLALPRVATTCHGSGSSADISTLDVTNGHTLLVTPQPNNFSSFQTDSTLGAVASSGQLVVHTPSDVDSLYLVGGPSTASPTQFLTGPGAGGGNFVWFDQ